MLRRDLLKGAASAVVALAAGLPATAALAQQQTVKVGFIGALTGPQAASGRQMANAIRLYQQINGDTVAGKKIEVIFRDDTGVADQTRRIAQELIVNEKVAFLAGFSLTPLALAVAPVITQAKTPAIIMTAGTSIITERSPYFARVSFTLPQQTMPMAEWAAKNGIKTVVTLVSDYGPGLDSEKAFFERFTALGGKVVAQLKAPLANPDFAPFLQRAADAKPDAIFLFVPGPQAGPLMRQVVDRGLTKGGIKIIGPGDITEDEQLVSMDDSVVGVITSHFYSTAHGSDMNKKFVADYKKANNGARPNFIGVGGWDGMHAIYEALRKTNGDTNGDKVMAALKGLEWESPRGRMSIDPQTRDVVQDVYIRRVERKDGELFNVEFDVVRQVKDPYRK
jgi:branched-chain amino acid transport system substrate-binding protein